MNVKFIKNERNTYVALFGVLFCIVCLIFGIGYLNSQPSVYPELDELRNTKWQFLEYANYLEKIADDKGGRYGFEVLAQATFPDEVDIHLLGHVVGDVLYKQEGLKGMAVCTQEFRNACSHSIVVGFFSEHGVGGLSEIVETCKVAPGGSGAYAMCFHGLGHGILAYYLYDLEKAVTLCKIVGPSMSPLREYEECIGGVIMEMFAGFHDRIAWEKEKEKYFKNEDPLYPCNAEFMPYAVQPVCYRYLTPRFFSEVNLDMSSFDPLDFPKAMALCEKIPKSNRESLDACYGGFGKEFVGLANNRDIRDIGLMSVDRVALVEEWCEGAGTLEGVRSCRSHALSSLFWGGENAPDAALSFCEIASENAQRSCYAELTTLILYYKEGMKNTAVLCHRLPDPHQTYCLERV